ncbi:riboflavin-binding protein-like [Narcine bancroftii]|uniref:riboflavin-binding protein-like n=1 Tax=Narcine bancroftii TaxID=1343680 RepID=UPI003830FF55
MLWWIAVVLLGGAVKQLDAICQATENHKAFPSPEPELYDCPLYSKNACCSVDSSNKMTTSPEIASWNTCGLLSETCEQFFKQLSCFYHCSPDAAGWADPSVPDRLLNVPLCRSFCNQWYKACKNDLTCTRSWNIGLKSNTSQTNCTSECIPYSKMYKNGKDLCESADGDSFKVRSCICLNMDKSDERVMKTLTQDDSTKADVNGKVMCREKRSVVSKARLPPRKRSLFVEDIDGSGSGFPTTE